MLLNFEERLSESPLVERIWRTQTEQAGAFTSVALSHWQMCVWTENGKTHLTMRGPETQATRVHCPANAEFLGIVFKLGTVMPHLPASQLVDADLTLPDASSKAFWLKGAALEYPNFDNADTFINYLVRDGLLVREPSIQAALKAHAQPISLRSIQRRFSQIIGLLLQQGVSILDTVDQAGYSDQPHLTRALRRFIGQTPAQIIGRNEPEQLSFLFKTAPAR